MSKYKKKKSKQKKIPSKRGYSFKRFFFGLLSIIAIAITSIYLYGVYKFDDIIKERITEIYINSTISKYYSLEFGKIRVDIISSNLKIFNVKFVPKIESNKSYFQKNGSINIALKAIKLKDFGIKEFLISNKITVDKIAFNRVDVSLTKNDNVFSPFAFIEKKEKNDTLNLDVSIGRLNLKGASFSFVDTKNKGNSTLFDKLDMEMDSLSFAKNNADFDLFLKLLKIDLYNINHSTEGGLDAKIGVLHTHSSDLRLIKNNNGLKYSYSNSNIEISNSELITADGVYGVSAKSIIYSEKKEYLIIKGATITPLVSRKKFIAKNRYQKNLFDIEISTIMVDNIDIEKLRNSEGIFAKHVDVNSMNVHLFKDKHKPLNKKYFPKYLAQQIFGIKLPIEIASVDAKDVNVFVEIIQADNKLSKIAVNNISANMLNVQNKYKSEKLYLKAKGKIDNSIPFKIDLTFNYSRNYYTYKGNISKSKLKKIAKSIESFAPIKVNNGQINSVNFSGYASRTESVGEMTFLYNNLNVEVERNNKQNTKVSDHLLSILANSVIYSSNPVKQGAPVRKVDYKVNRDMNKGFINMLIKTVLTGAKETVLPSKENRKKYRLVKKKNRH